ncbi:MAG: hypothetical protein IPG96_12335 [Proteobacteria bacterium]|nr:hypothetical protein [Pseudomonadota bacterium]
MSRAIVSLAAPDDFFRELIELVLAHHGLKPHEATAAYLVRLLCELVQRPIEELDRPLALALARSHTSHPADRIRALLRIGEDALYLTSFFRQYLRRRQLDVGYYETLGGTAYRQLSRLTARRPAAEGSLHLVFGELSEAFPRFAGVLADVHLHGLPDTDLGTLYETWLETGSKLLEARLRDAGMVSLRPRDGSEGQN